MNIKRIAITLVGVIIIVLLLKVVIRSCNMNETLQTSGKTLSNTKIGWGVKRVPDHKQPDLGSVNINLMNKYEGIAIGNENSKKVYLTFDQGYEAGYTEKILDELKENNVKATFFVTAHYINTAPELVQRMIDEGHIVGNHTVNHKSMPSISDEEIEKEIMDLHKSVYEKFGYEMQYTRPPKGEFSERTLAKTNSLGYKTVMWSLAYDDWDENKQGREEYGKKKIVDNIHPGAVILLHATSKDNANILSDCIKTIKEMGYEFKNIDEFER